MNPILKFYHQEIFQGSLKKKNYFEGWYFKHVSADTGNAFAVIPGISVSGDSHSFIQYVDGNSGKTSYFRYETGDFEFNRNEFEIQIGKSQFSANGISLDLNNSDFSVLGEISYSEISRLPKSILMPGIMGWYSYVPGMECNHEVVSVNHKLSGSLRINGMINDFTGGNGYIEKDWGTSFPESWLWLQCNDFNGSPVATMISVAKIPWMGSYFIGFVAFVSIEGRTEILATYNGAKVEKLKRIDENTTEVRLKKGHFSLSAIITKKGTGTLKAPKLGVMESNIKESINSEVSIEYSNGGNIIFSGKGTRAGYEETDKIFTYF